MIIIGEKRKKYKEDYWENREELGSIKWDCLHVGAYTGRAFEDESEEIKIIESIFDYNKN